MLAAITAFSFTEYEDAVAHLVFWGSLNSFPFNMKSVANRPGSTMKTHLTDVLKVAVC